MFTPASAPSPPTRKPSWLVGASQLCTSVDELSVRVQPSPRPVIQEITTKATAEPASTPNITRAPRILVCPHCRAHAAPRQQIAAAATILMFAATVSSASAATSRDGLDGPPSAISIPASTRPAINPSLCAPATACHSTKGFSRPSHNANPGDTPLRCASRGSAQAIRAAPASSTTRFSNRVTSTFSPATWAIVREIAIQTGP